MIFVLRVTAGQEKVVAQMLVAKVKSKKLNVYSIFYPENVRGYLFVEADDENTALKLATKTKHVKGVLKTPIATQEVEKMIKAPKPKAVMVEVGDIVEITSGPFKGEKAKVTKAEEDKDEYTVLPLEVAIAIPVKVKGKHIKVYRKKEDVESLI